MSANRLHRSFAAALLSADTSLAAFTKAAWPLIEPSTPLVWGWALDAICEHVEALLTGRLGRQNLMVLVPPGSMKSTITAAMAPAWMWITHPSWRGIFASGNPSVSVRDSLRCRAILESAWYRQTFGITWRLAPDENLKTRFSNTTTGSRLAISAQTRVTGDRADALFIDDPLDAAETYSDTAREGVARWYDEAFANRLNDPARGTRCIMQQRLHTEDLAGHILAREADQWEVLCIPMLWEESRRTRTSLGWTDPRSADGELMFPERFPQQSVADEALRLGESGFAGQHQQRPFSASGEIFKTGRLQSWDADSPLPDFQQTILSLDPAFKTKQTNDYSVVCVLGQFDRGIFLLDVVRGRYAYPQLRAIVAELYLRWRPNAVLIEDTASGQSLVQDLQQNTAFPLHPVKPDGDKVMRANVIVPSWESGRIFVRTGSPWLREFLEELHAFPKAPHDDQVDAFVQGVRYLATDDALEIWRILGAADRTPLFAAQPVTSEPTPTDQPADTPAEGTPNPQPFITLTPPQRIVPLGQHLLECLAADQKARESAAAQARADNEARLAGR